MKNIAFGIYFFFLSFNSKPNRTQNLQEEFIQHDDDYGTRRSFMVIQEESFSFKATQVKDWVARNNKIVSYFHDKISNSNSTYSFIVDIVHEGSNIRFW